MDAASKKSNSLMGPILIIGALFFILGFITWLNGLLVSYLKTACELSDFQALFVVGAFYISYTVMALPSSWVLRKTGFKNGMMLSLWVMAVGSLIFIPAAYSRYYPVFLFGLFVLGSGMAILQTAVNPYITILGPIESAARRISIMGISNKLAGALAPLALGYFIVHQGDEALFESIKNMGAAERATELDALAHRVIVPYIGMAVILFLVGLGIRFSSLPDIDEEDEKPEEIQAADKRSIFSFPHLILGVITLFFYVGVEVIAGDTIIRYGQAQGFALADAKVFTSYTMIAMIAGYLIGTATIPKIISQRQALLGSALLGIVFSLAAIFTEGYVSVLFIALLGLANALVWPAVWPLAIHNLGHHIKTGSALLIMAISGGAVLSVSWGALSDHFGPQEAYWILVPSYLVILFYALKGHKMRSW
jgi:glucose/galactose transporter